MKRLLVTGAGGYVGTNLVTLLAATGWEVRALGPHASSSAGLPLGTEWVTGSVLDPAGLAAGMEGCDAVVHLAARITLLRRDDAAWELNTRGPALVAAEARRRGIRMVHCSSVHALDCSVGGIIDEDSPASGTHRPLYDRSKAAGEQAVAQEMAAGLDAVICRPTGVVGPVDRKVSRINGFILAAARGRLPAVVRGGFDWVDVRDVAAGIVASLEHGRAGRAYLLGGTSAEIMTLTTIGAVLAGRRGPWLALPQGMVRPLAPLAELVGGWLGSDVLTPASFGALADSPRISSARARTELGYRTRPLAATVHDLLVDAGIPVADGAGPALG